ncbi:hypothetical protein C8Q76DRAFT_695026 [Earliella scabrosa]|nr:hypothetical protein C8Q76DRAFT_695026 [Earliella scabrosa]
MTRKHAWKAGTGSMSLTSLDYLLMPSAASPEFNTPNAHPPALSVPPPQLSDIPGPNIPSKLGINTQGLAILWDGRVYVEPLLQQYTAGSHHPQATPLQAKSAHKPMYLSSHSPPNMLNIICQDSQWLAALGVILDPILQSADSSALPRTMFTCGTGTLQLLHLPYWQVMQDQVESGEDKRAESSRSMGALTCVEAITTHTLLLQEA